MPCSAGLPEPISSSRSARTPSPGSRLSCCRISSVRDGRRQYAKPFGINSEGLKGAASPRQNHSDQARYKTCTGPVSARGSAAQDCGPAVKSPELQVLVDFLERSQRASFASAWTANHRRGHGRGRLRVTFRSSSYSRAAQEDSRTAGVGIGGPKMEAEAWLPVPHGEAGGARLRRGAAAFSGNHGIRRKLRRRLRGEAQALHRHRRSDFNLRSSAS